jgi:hypothetical protein
MIVEDLAAKVKRKSKQTKVFSSQSRGKTTQKGASILNLPKHFYKFREFACKLSAQASIFEQDEALSSLKNITIYLHNFEIQANETPSQHLMGLYLMAGPEPFPLVCPRKHEQQKRRRLSIYRHQKPGGFARPKPRSHWHLLEFFGPVFF